MNEDPVRGFLGRWSRLKREAAGAPPALAPETPDVAPAEGAPVASADVAPVPDAPDAEPPPLESLNFDSDYRAFLGAKVDEGLKRSALKKLFNAPHFNEMDGLDVYIEDFGVFEPLPRSVVDQLVHARETLCPTLPEDWLKAPGDIEVAQVSPAVADAQDGPDEGDVPAPVPVPDALPADSQEVRADDASRALPDSLHESRSGSE
jgi:hypothetical protein